MSYFKCVIARRSSENCTVGEISRSDLYWREETGFVSGKDGATVYDSYEEAYSRSKKIGRRYAPYGADVDSLEEGTYSYRNTPEQEETYWKRTMAEANYACHLARYNSGRTKE